MSSFSRTHMSSPLLLGQVSNRVASWEHGHQQILSHSWDPPRDATGAAPGGVTMTENLHRRNRGTWSQPSWRCSPSRAAAVPRGTSFMPILKPLNDSAMCWVCRQGEECTTMTTTSTNRVDLEEMKLWGQGKKRTPDGDTRKPH